MVTSNEVRLLRIRVDEMKAEMTSRDSLISNMKVEADHFRADIAEAGKVIAARDEEIARLRAEDNPTSRRHFQHRAEIAEARCAQLEAVLERIFTTQEPSRARDIAAEFFIKENQ